MSSSEATCSFEPSADLPWRCLAEREIAEERYQHRAAALDPACQGMADDLHLLGPGKIRNFACEGGWIERFTRENIEIERLPVTEPQRERGPATQREMFGCRVELRSQRPL